MSIARITMMEYMSKKEMAASEDFYQTIQKEWFGNAQTVINTHRSNFTFVVGRVLRL